MSETGDVSLELYLSLVRFLLLVLWRKEGLVRLDWSCIYR